MCVCVCVCVCVCLCACVCIVRNSKNYLSVLRTKLLPLVLRHVWSPLPGPVFPDGVLPWIRVQLKKSE